MSDVLIKFHWKKKSSDSWLLGNLGVVESDFVSSFFNKKQPRWTWKNSQVDWMKKLCTALQWKMMESVVDVIIYFEIYISFYMVGVFLQFVFVTYVQEFFARWFGDWKIIHPDWGNSICLHWTGEKNCEGEWLTFFVSSIRRTRSPAGYSFPAAMLVA